MFRLQRQNRATKSGERIDFKFSNFQAIRVPKGWDRLFVTVVSVESGKTIAKSSKAPVRSGNCQWTETLSESIWFSQYDSIKALEECLFKFVISMGSARSGILGEATVNMADYMSSKAPVPVFLQLKKCNHGSILQVKIHCLTPRTKLRDEESNSTNSHTEEQDAENRDMEDKSNGSSDSFSGNVGYPASKELGSTSHPEELQSSETSLSATASHHGFSSADYCKNCMREIFSSRIHDVNGDNYSSVGRQDSIINSVQSSHISYPAEDPSLSNHASFNSVVTYYSANGSQTQWKESQHVSNASFSVTNPDSSKKLREAAEDTTEQLRAEAGMWERNARKLMIELELLRMEFSDLSRKQADIDTEVSGAYMERDGLKQEVEKMKILLEESMLEKKSIEDSSFQSEAALRIRKEMENEIKFQRECNVNLSTQLARSQESNIELLSVLQELEDAVEMQKVEITNLSTLKLTFNDISVLRSSVDSHVSESNILEMKCSELEIKKHELELHLSNLEKERIELLEQVSCFEAQHRCTIDETKSMDSSLQDEIRRLVIEMDTLKLDFTRKLQDMKNQCSEAVEECGNLKLINQKLQVSIEILIEERDLLQQKNGQLRKQKLELHEGFTHTETQLRESQKKSFDYAKRVGCLEENLSAMLEAFASKEGITALEIDGLIQENWNQQEKLATIESSLNKGYFEKMAEIEKLRRERDQISVNHREIERTAFEAAHEVSILQANKAKMESDNEELKSMLKVIENELDAVRRESKLKVQDLTAELSNSKKNHELLVAAHEKMSLESKRSSEEKLMTAINDLEVKHTVSDHERQLLIEETASLKVQLQKVALLHDEILGLKSEKEKLEASLRSVSRDCEELKSVNFGLETSICEFEECKFQKVALEEKLLQMASDTSARERDVTKENEKFHLKIQLLEAEKGECLKKSQALEECLKSIGEQMDVRNQSECQNGEKVQFLENELAQAMEANSNYKMQLQRMTSEGSSNHTPLTKERSGRTKSSLEAELKDLQDRYFQMSLKYAEVEAQREDLVMKLKEAKNGKKWFS